MKNSDVIIQNSKMCGEFCGALFGKLARSFMKFALRLTRNVFLSLDLTVASSSVILKRLYKNTI